MYDYLPQLIGRHREQGIAFDTNLLLVLIVGTFDASLIARFKRTNRYAAKDYEFLAQFRQHFRQTVATPSVWTEVTNWIEPLARSIVGDHNNRLAKTLRSEVQTVEERYATTSKLADLEYFVRLGLTDTALIKVAEEGPLVVTVDSELATTLTNLGHDCLDYNLIRPWIYS